MFNPNARWDREFPEDDNKIGEDIEAGVVFKNGKICPRWFKIAENRYMIKNINFTWKEKKGKETFYIFSVSDENNAIYKICFRPNKFSWILIDECQ